MGERVLVAMSGGVDSSVAALLLKAQGYDLVGVTLKLWGGISDQGCCTVADVEDARRVASLIGIDHLVWSFTDKFNEKVVDYYVSSIVSGETPNPCIECNRHIKFDLLLNRAKKLGFKYLATGHYARIVAEDGINYLYRAKDFNKDQSYVLSMLRSDDLAFLKFPIGNYSKGEIRRMASNHGLVTANKPDSTDICFILASGGKKEFLSQRINFTRARLVDLESGSVTGAVDDAELVTVGQRKSLGTSIDKKRRYVIEKNLTENFIKIGSENHLYVSFIKARACRFVNKELNKFTPERVIIQTSAHGQPSVANLQIESVDTDMSATVTFFSDRKLKIVAPGQTVAIYSMENPAKLIGSAIAC